jgi:hypothetical protein
VTATAGTITLPAVTEAGGPCVKKSDAMLAATTVTVACSVIATLLIVAETVFTSAFVELKVQVATPFTSVVLVAEPKLFAVPLTVIVAPTLGTGLPAMSLAVTVIVVAVDAATLHPGFWHAVIVARLV